MGKIILGAPSLSGKDANELVAATFKDTAFPLKIKISNLVGHCLSFPGNDGLHLYPVYDVSRSSVAVEIKDYDALQRLASDIEMIAELNQHGSMLTIEVFDEEALEVGDEVGATGKKAGKEKAV